MHRALLIVLCLGLLSGLLPGRFVQFVHLEHHQHPHGEGCETATLVHGEAPGDSHHADEGAPCTEHPGGACHQHLCQHSVSPGVTVFHLPLLLSMAEVGAVPVDPASFLDEPVFELEKPPLILA